MITDLDKINENWREIYGWNFRALSRRIFSSLEKCICYVKVFYHYVRLFIWAQYSPFITVNVPWDILNKHPILHLQVQDRNLHLWLVRASSHKADRHLTARSHEVSKLRYLGSDCFNRYEIWQAPRQRHRDACQFSKRYGNHNIQSRCFETWWLDVLPLTE